MTAIDQIKEIAHNVYNILGSGFAEPVYDQLTHRDGPQ